MVCKENPDRKFPVPTITEMTLAERWHVSRRTLQRWRDVGQVPTWFRVGRCILYRLSDVERFEESLMRIGEKADDRV